VRATDWWIVATIGMAVVAWVVRAFWEPAPPRQPQPQRRRPRLFDLRPVTPIAAIKDGDRVRITGRAAARADLLVSPVGRHPCIGFQLIVEKREPGLVGKWVRVLTQQDLGSFSLTDETGEAAVDGPFEVDLETDESSWTTMPVWLFVTLKEQGVPFTEPFGDKEQFRYAETILSVGDRIPHLKGSETEPVIIADD